MTSMYWCLHLCPLMTTLPLSMDEPTLKELHQLHNPHIFVPLGNAPLVRSIGYPDSHAHHMDWWDVREMTLALPAADGSANSVTTTIKITSTPCQHQANRGMFDRWKSLWSSWALEGAGGQRVFFGGDTAYRTVLKGEDEEKVPTCPAFKEVGEQFGDFDLALLPIG
jgi:N-acyl-phosphatidylethanolamine-hydrolysing phospholipase D